ncbi:mat-specific pheromone precursor encoded by the mfm protein [Podospora fimiseda]|uniref:Mat-specific pheromone encoded by the mfm protein n=1 Tax=Podospora fimiseda TaxID=252190 RepID=A0AAN7BTG8_9PEZI|nr:mat-specific pheromone precursor encoded by the mfm protein [Podospora fimiseda]
MKFSLPVTLLAVATVNASAIQQEDKRFCNSQGEACHTVARAAEAFAAAVKANAVTSREGTGPAVTAARQVDQLALAISASQPDPIAFYEALGFGSPIEFETNPAKREAEPEAEPQGWCSFTSGQPCWKRNADPGVKRCNQEGSSCWQAKRAAEAVINAIDTNHDEVAKRNADPGGWCSKFPGQSCWKRDASPQAACYAPNGACTLATRDVHAMYNAARHIIDAASA